MAYSYNYEIAASGGTLTNLMALSVPVIYPKHSYKPYTQYDKTGSGVLGRGHAEAIWHWDTTGIDYIPRAQRDKLKTFCPGTSAAVDIRTRTNENTDEYKYFHAVMVWPEDEEKDASVRFDFSIKFINLVEYTPV